jgi:hypothetical protein
MSYLCLMAIAVLFFGQAVQSVFAGNWPLFFYAILAGALQLSVIAMAK